MRGAPVRLARNGGLKGLAAEERGTGETDGKEKDGEKKSWDLVQRPPLLRRPVAEGKK